MVLKSSTPIPKLIPIPGKYVLCSVAICFSGIILEVGNTVTNAQKKAHFKRVEF